MKVTDYIKDILDLVRDVVFGCGIVALLGVIFYEPETIGLTKHMKLIGWT
jgi:hypothetical protein